MEKQRRLTAADRVTEEATKGPVPAVPKRRSERPGTEYLSSWSTGTQGVSQDVTTAAGLPGDGQPLAEFPQLP